MTFCEMERHTQVIDIITSYKMRGDLITERILKSFAYKVNNKLIILPFKLKEA